MVDILCLFSSGEMAVCDSEFEKTGFDCDLVDLYKSVTGMVWSQQHE